MLKAHNLSFCYTELTLWPTY